MSTELVPSISIANLLQQRDAIVERLQQVNRLLTEAADIAYAAGIADDAKYQHFTKLVGHGGRGYGWVLPLATEECVQSARKRLDNAAWDCLLRQSGLVSFMDSKTREKWREDIEKGAAPELTPENIKATFGRMYEERGEMFEQGVVRCFRALSWKYSTNLPQRFGRRIHARVRWYGSISSEHVNQLEDLQRVFCKLDRKPEEDHRSGLYHRLHEAERLDGDRYRRRDRFEHSDEFMHFRVYKNGNAAITFLRPDLVDQLNRIIAKHYPNCLPPPGR